MDSAKSALQQLKSKSIRVLDSGYSHDDVLKSIIEDVGDNTIVGCVKTSGYWTITMKNSADAELIQDTGLEIKGEQCEVWGVEKSILTVSLFGVPCYISDSELTNKLEEYGCVIKAKWTRKYYENYPGVENGTRFARVQLPNKAKSLPYVIVVAGEHLKLKHNRQSKVCNICLSDDHVMRQCPEYVCRECEGHGHPESRCPKVKCFRCLQFGHKSFVCPKNDAESETWSEQDSTDTNSVTTPKYNTKEQKAQNKQADFDNEPPAQLLTGDSSTTDHNMKDEEEIGQDQPVNDKDSHITPPNAASYPERNSSKPEVKEKASKANSIGKPSSQPSVARHTKSDSGVLKRTVSSDDNLNLQGIRKSSQSAKKKLVTPNLRTARNLFPIDSNSTSR